MSQEKAQYNDTKLQKVYKEFYDENNYVREMEYSTDPLLTAIGKGEMEDYEQIVQGKYVVVPIKNGGRLGSHSKTFADAQTGSQSSDGIPDYEAFHVLLDKETVVGRVDVQTMKATRGKRGSYIKPLLESTNDSITTLQIKRSAQLYRDGSNQLGKVGAKSGKTITLANKWDAPLFYRGAQIEIRDAAALGTLHQTSTVTQINRKTGVVTFKDNIAAAVAATDVLYYKGDYGKRCFFGLSAWLRASSADGGKNFLNVDRTVDDARLAGVKMSTGSGDLRDVLIECPTEMHIQTGLRPKLDCYIMHPKMIENLTKEMKSSYEHVRREMTDSKLGTVGYDAFKVYLNKHKPIDIVESIYIDANTIYALDKSTWLRFHYDDELVTFDSGDGLNVLRSPNDDSLEVRGYSFMGLCCPTPGKNAVIKVTSGNSAYVS